MTTVCPDCGTEVATWRECWQTLFGEDVWHLVALCRSCGWNDDRITTNPSAP